MKLISESPEIVPRLVIGFQQSVAPAYFEMVGYSDEFAKPTQADVLGVTIG
jgi:hypothetical protein